MRWVQWLQNILFIRVWMWRRRFHWGTCFQAGGGFVCIAAVALAAVPTRSLPEGIRTSHLEIINSAGQVVAVIRGTEAGGHLEIKDGSGGVVFSTGGIGGNDGHATSWEHARHEQSSQRRDLAQQQLALHDAMRVVRKIEQQNQQLRRMLPRAERLSNDQELSRLHRALNAVEQQVSRLRRDVDRLERR